MMKRLLILFFITILALGGYIFFFSKGAAESPAGAPPGMAGGMPPTGVSVMTLDMQSVPVTKTLPGRVSAIRQAEVRPQVNGIVTARMFEEGTSVEKGEQLYQIDDARYKAALASAVADLKSARANIGAVEARAIRYEELVKIDAVSQQEYEDVKAQRDQAKAGVAVAQAAVDVAKVNLGYTKVYAPISGRIGRSLVTEGALVTANQQEPMAVITQLDPVYIDLQRSGIEAIELQRQAGVKGVIPITLMIGETENMAYPHEGTMKFSEVTIDETTGSITMRAEMPNPDGMLLPGLFVRAQLNLGERQVLLVPQRAASRTPDGSLSVWVMNPDNTAAPKSFTAGDAYKSYWIVTEGLASGETIIVEGYQKIGPGMPLNPMPYNPDGHTRSGQDINDTPLSGSTDISADIPEGDPAPETGDIPADTGNKAPLENIQSDSKMESTQE